MRLILRNFTLIVFITLFTSCAYHQGTLSSSTPIFKNHYSIVGMAAGASQAVRVLGIGGLNHDAMVADAKNNLYSNYGLGKDQAYANFSVDFKRSFFGVYSKTKVVVTADIIEKNGNKIVSEVDKKPGNILLMRGDSIKITVAGKNYSARIIDFSGTLATVQYEDTYEHLRIRTQNLFSYDRNPLNEILIKSYYERDDRVSVYINEEIKKGKLTRLFLTHADFETDSGEKHDIRYNQIEGKIQ